jgi:phosphoenolpyruvate synthase/pyruvate phosphate dikinase
VRLESTEKGKEWVKKFYDFLEVEGWRMVRMNDITEPYWLEDPGIPIGIVRRFMEEGYNLDERRRELVKQREKAEEVMLEKVNPEEREMFLLLIRLAQRAGIYSEEHDLYCELYMHALLRRGYLAIGRRLTAYGSIDKSDDVFFLNPDEIERAIIVPEHHDLRFITKRRREEWDEAKKTVPPPIITDRHSDEEAIAKDLMASKDAIFTKLIIGEPPQVKPELKADLYGLCGSHGVAEGDAIIVMDYEGLRAVNPGNILVCPNPNPSWIPIFGVITGIVTDAGGTLSHAAIVAREHKIPAVVNTREATRKIRTGQKLRIDAKEGAVFILNK